MNMLTSNNSKAIQRSGAFSDKRLGLSQKPVLRSSPRSAMARRCCLPSRSILVPTDFSPVSLQALDYAIGLAKRLRASILVVHVLTPAYAGGLSDSQTRRQLAQQAEAKTLEHFAALKTACRERGVVIHFVIRDGMPEFEIARVAENRHVDLIVIGRRKRGVVARWLLGSVSNEIVDVAPCPVLVVKSVPQVQAELQ